MRVVIDGADLNEPVAVEDVGDFLALLLILLEVLLRRVLLNADELILCRHEYSPVKPVEIGGVIDDPRVDEAVQV